MSTFRSAEPTAAPRYAAGGSYRYHLFSVYYRPPKGAEVKVQYVQRGDRLFPVLPDGSPAVGLPSSKVKSRWLGIVGEIAVMAWLGIGAGSLAGFLTTKAAATLPTWSHILTTPAVKVGKLAANVYGWYGLAGVGKELLAGNFDADAIRGVAFRIGSGFGFSGAFTPWGAVGASASHAYTLGGAAAGAAAGVVVAGPLGAAAGAAVGGIGGYFFS